MKIIRHYNRLIVGLHAHFAPLAVIAVAVCLLVWLPEFEYRQSPLLPERAWLALAGQLTHLNASHLLFNGLGLLALGWGFAPWRTGPHDAGFALAGLAGVWAGLMLNDTVVWYRGLSGALHGVFAAYATWIALTDRRPTTAWVCLLLLGGLAVKLWLEPAWSGLPVASIASDSGTMPVLYAAHGWGAAAGCLAGLTSAWGTRRMKQKTRSGEAPD